MGVAAGRTSVGLTGVIISVIAATVAAAEPAVCQGVDWRSARVSTAAYPQRRKDNNNDSELCEYFQLRNGNRANLVLGRQLWLVQVVKEGERNGEREDRKDVRNALRAEVRLGDGSISVMFCRIKQKVQPTKLERGGQICCQCCVSANSYVLATLDHCPPLFPPTSPPSPSSLTHTPAEVPYLAWLSANCTCDIYLHSAGRRAGTNSNKGIQANLSCFLSLSLPEKKISFRFSWKKSIFVFCSSFLVVGFRLNIHNESTP